MGAFVVLVAVKLGIFPVPLAANPIAVLLFVHAKEDPIIGLTNESPGSVFPLQYTTGVVGTTSGPIIGVGFTVIEKESETPTHPLAVGTILIVAVIGVFVVFEAVKLGIFPVPPVANPMAVFVFVHAKEVLVTGLVSAIVGEVFVFAYVKFGNAVPMVVVGFTVIV